MILRTFAFAGCVLAIACAETTVKPLEEGSVDEDGAFDRAHRDGGIVRDASSDSFVPNLDASAADARTSDAVTDSRFADVQADASAATSDASRADASTPTLACGSRSFALPASIDLGEASPFASADFDCDGYLDLGYYIAPGSLEGSPGRGTATLLVQFGSADGWSSRDLISKPLAHRGTTGPRDVSSDVVLAIDTTGDGALDLVSADGIWSVARDRTATWLSFGDTTERDLQAVAWFPASNEVARGTTRGAIELCNASTGVCRSLSGHPNASCPVECDISTMDIGAGDFDGDGARDLLVGMNAFAELPQWRSHVYWGPSLTTGTTVAHLSGVDWELGDMDRDGDVDIVAQIPEYISDFPSDTQVWRATRDRSAPFEVLQTIHNMDNHNDVMSLADFNGDGCLDIVHVGVDESTFAYSFGRPSGATCTGFLGVHDPDRSSDFFEFGAVTPGYDGMIGVQTFDANGDGTAEWVTRLDWGAVSHVLRFARVLTREP